ncbi:MAG: PQQ-binding-like beta-propeller repeat protein [Thermoguttaceae bacterium]|jgi:outer membrane protein assembly factor BamB
MSKPSIAVWFGLSVVTFAAAASAQESAPLVKHLLDIAHKTKGVCLVPGGGELAFDLVKGSEFVVVSQEPNAARTAAMRAKADQAGLLGRRLYIAEADAGTSVLADNYANVLVIADATDDLLAKLDAKAMLKALTPHGGKAIVGLAKGSAGTLTKANLETWAKGFGVQDIKVVQDAFGLWAIITRPQLPGAAEWMHRFFDSGFNPVSTDTAFTMPSMTQWLGTPYNHGAGAPRIAGGKLLSVMEGAYSARRPEVEVNFLVMRDAYNGRILWKRDLGEKYAADYYLSSVVMTADAVYLVDMPNPTVLVLHPDTEEELRRIDCSSLGKQVKWIALRDGVLFAAAGGTDHTGGVWNGVFGAQHLKFIRDRAETLKDSIAVGNNRMIGAFDPKTGKTLWSHDEAQDCIPEFFLAVRDGRVYFLAQEKYAGALDVKNGKLLWTNPEAAAIYRDNLYPQFAVGSGALEVSDSTLLFARPGSARIALNAEDGKLLWFAPKYGGHQQCGSLIWDKYVLGQKSVDLRTGAAVPEFAKSNNPYRNICTFGAATVNYITGSMNGPAYDLTAMKPVTRPTYFHKSPCSMGSVVGEGILFMSSFHCACDYQLNGNIIEMSGDARQYQKPAVESERLVLSANPNPPAPLFPTAADWPVFRASNTRSNASTAEVPDNVALRWSFALGEPYVNPEYPSDRSETSYEPAQPIAAANLVITSGPDGAVRALDLASGKPVWSFYTGGQITQSPAVADGRAYVPSGDGFLYCLDAKTGRELWHFCAAPAERRIMVYGHLVSTWPLFAGVLVQDGVAYTAASLLNMDATHVYALDAKTGHIIWQNNSSGLPNRKSEDGATAVGTLTVAQGRLWVRTTSYDLKTGKCALFADAKASYSNKDNGGNSLLQRYTGVLQGKFLLFGGRRFYESQSRPLPIGRSPQSLSIIELNADGTGIYPRIDLANYTGAFAAWDDRQLIATPVLEDKTSINGAIKHFPILCWDLAKTVSLAQAQRAEAATISDYVSQVKWNAKLNSRNSWERLGELPMHQWLVDTHRTYAVVLCPNAVVAAYGMMDAPEKFARHNTVVPTKWFVSALDRATGKELWKQPLPSEPVYDGICIARDGSVIVQLLDGGVVCIAKAE